MLPDPDEGEDPSMSECGAVRRTLELFIRCLGSQHFKRKHADTLSAAYQWRTNFPSREVSTDGLRGHHREMTEIDDHQSSTQIRSGTCDGQACAESLASV